MSSMGEIIVHALALWVVIMSVIFGFKKTVTYDNRFKITGAIYKYRMWKKGCGLMPDINYSDLKDFNRCLFDITDWGCKNMLPPEKFEKIKMFL